MLFINIYFLLISLSFTLSQFNNNECLSGLFRFISSEYGNCSKCNSKFIYFFFCQLMDGIKCIRVFPYIFPWSTMNTTYTLQKGNAEQMFRNQLRENCHAIRKKTVSFNENANFLCESKSICSALNECKIQVTYRRKKRTKSVWLNRCNCNWKLCAWWTVVDGGGRVVLFYTKGTETG